jgi:hypothetical protein
MDDRRRRASAPSRRVLAAAAVLTLVVVSSVRLPAQSGDVVKVTVPRANVRSEPRDNAPILLQAKSGDSLPLLGVEGDWFHVRLQLGAKRVDAYISKKVSTLVKAPPVPAPAEQEPPPPTPTPTAAPVGAPTRGLTPVPAPTAVRTPPNASAAAAPPAQIVDGISVALSAGDATSPMQPHELRFRRSATKLQSYESMAVALPRRDAADRDVQTWAWILETDEADQVLDDRQPAFIVNYTNVPGVAAGDVSPAIVRLASLASGGRLVAATRGTMALASTMTPEWDPGRELKQDVVRVEVQMIEPGVAKVRPVVDLPVGQYAVVLRPATRKRLPGAVILSHVGIGRVLSLAWDFGIR